MTTYWLSFRLHENSTYEERYAALENIVLSNSSMYWKETTSFIVFSSNISIQSVAASIKRVINPKIDLFLIRILDTKSAIICGNNQDQDIYKLIPYLITI
jgi:hypothetical protein